MITNIEDMPILYLRNLGDEAVGELFAVVAGLAFVRWSDGVVSQSSFGNLGDEFEMFVTAEVAKSFERDEDPA